MNHVKEKRTKKKDPLAWEEVQTEHIIQDEWIDFRKSSYRFPDGTVFLISLYSSFPCQPLREVFLPSCFPCTSALTAKKAV